ncbi:MAG: hypothetical protein J6A37_06915 [Oscillospiraceae bacterium]|nr:hypothetical protein [Oscillospiraceae bacterium]
MTPNEFFAKRFNAVEGKTETLTPNEYQKLAMHEILFRGKCKNTGEWVEGSYLSKASNTNACIMWHEDGHIVPQICAIIPETVGQYTGLTDKNGKKIFEGDIVDCWSEGINARGIVQQRIDGLWIIYPSWQKSTFWGLCPSSDGSTSVEIIGNITDNPELLKGGGSND